VKFSHLFKVIKYIILITIIAAITYLFIYISQKPEIEKEAIPIPVLVRKPIIQDVPVSLSTYVYVQARSIIPIVPLVNGEVKEHFVKVGDYVNKGDIISQLDDEILSLNEQNAKAAYNVALSSFERTKQLFDSGSLSKQVADEVKGKYEVAKGQHELAKTQLTYTTIHSPISGTIIASDVSVGSMGQVSHPVAVVSDLEDLVLNITLPSNYWSIIQAHKDNLEITVEIKNQASESKIIGAKVETISPIINPQNASFTISCALDATDSNDIRVGMYLKVNVRYKLYKNAFTIPHSALSNNSHIFTYDKKTKAVTRSPLNNFTSYDTYIMVDSSLKNEWIVVKGTHLLTDSQVVEATHEDK